MQYFGTFSDEELDCFDPDRPTIMLRYLCFACDSRTEINCGTETVESEPESQDEKDGMMTATVFRWIQDEIQKRPEPEANEQHEESR